MKGKGEIHRKPATVMQVHLVRRRPETGDQRLTKLWGWHAHGRGCVGFGPNGVLLCHFVVVCLLCV